MYHPEAFRLEDDAAIRQIVADCPLALLATNGADGPEATHLPMIFDADGAALLGHFARANPHWKALRGDGAPALAVFRSADGYVTPGWYPEKRATGKVVPTWNYVTVHVRGRASLIVEAEAQRAVLARLTDAMEAGAPKPWAMEDAPEGYIGAMMRGLVVFRLEITSIETTAKLSQNKDAATRAEVRAGFAGTGNAAIAAAMRDS